MLSSRLVVHTILGTYLGSDDPGSRGQQSLPKSDIWLIEVCGLRLVPVVIAYRVKSDGGHFFNHGSQHNPYRYMPVHTEYLPMLDVC